MCGGGGGDVSSGQGPPVWYRSVIDLSGCLRTSNLMFTNDRTTTEQSHDSAV